MLPSEAAPEDAWYAAPSPGLRADQLRALGLVLAVACLLLGSGAALTGALLSDRHPLSIVGYAVSALAAVGSALLARSPGRRPVMGQASAPAPDGTDLGRDLLRLHPVLAPWAIIGVAAGLGVLIAGAATQGSSEPGPIGPTRICLAGAACPTPSLTSSP